MPLADAMIYFNYRNFSSSKSVEGKGFALSIDWGNTTNLPRFGRNYTQIGYYYIGKYDNEPTLPAIFTDTCTIVDPSNLQGAELKTSNNFGCNFNPSYNINYTIQYFVNHDSVEAFTLYQAVDEAADTEMKISFAPSAHSSLIAVRDAGDISWTSIDMRKNNGGGAFTDYVFIEADTGSGVSYLNNFSKTITFQHDTADSVTAYTDYSRWQQDGVGANTKWDIVRAWNSTNPAYNLSANYTQFAKQTISTAISNWEFWVYSNVSEKELDLQYAVSCDNGTTWAFSSETNGGNNKTNVACANSQSSNEITYRVYTINSSTSWYAVMGTEFVQFDTTPPEIKFYWATSDADPSCTRWNTDKQNPCNTTDKTPTVKINLSEISFCAISTLDLNYTEMIANDALTNCTGAPNALGKNLTCTLPDTKEFTSQPGLFNISIGCKDEAGNENKSSTSGRLLLNITDALPPIVTLENPDNNAVLFFKNRPFNFTFTATDDFGLPNITCNLYFNNTLNDTKIVANGTSTNFTPINLSRDTWQWNVSCTDNSSNTGFSARIVTINNTKPTAPTLQTPANNSGFGNLPSNLPEFTWANSADDDADAITYTIEVNNQSNFAGTAAYFNNSISEDSDGITGVNVTLPATDEDAYFWRVRANDGFENSSFSQTFQFAYANWTITFNLTSSDTGQAIDTIGGGSTPSFDISCINGYTQLNAEQEQNTNTFHTATNTFAHGDYNCTFSEIIDVDLKNYRDVTTTIIADNDKTIQINVSRIGGLTEEEHNWLQFLYTCFNTGECIDLLRTINQTTKDIWKRVTGTDTSVVIFENITSNTLSSTSNISIDYTIDIPIKEGYAVGELLPLRMFFWITDVNKTTCFNQDKSTDTNRAEAPYCLPLVAETLGPNGGEVNFTVDLRPNIPNGDYNITRSIEIDPIVNNEVTWINYGQESIGQIKVLEPGNADLFLLKTGESIPIRTAQTTTGITGAATATELTTSVMGVVIILSVIILGLSGYIVHINKKK
ncbi:hypothetical protein J4458_03100 [Candidatus Woesearchaeota archaeon]|nr:hypothetical protein [Candidatus Woesearchaeota archaeon]